MSTETAIIRMLVALILGGMIGWQREHMHKPAGLRTHLLVCLGSALTMMTGIYLTTLYPNLDPTRISAQVISGIGFLGAGTIIKDKGGIIGLTTASSIWLVGCVGLAIGCGFYIGAIGMTLLSFISLMKIRVFNKKETNEKPTEEIEAQNQTNSL